MKVTSGVLALVSAGMTTTSLVSASTIKLPLRSAAIREDGLGPRGTSKFRTTSPSSSGVKVPVTDWFNRTDNQVSLHPSFYIKHIFLCVPVDKENRFLLNFC